MRLNSVLTAMALMVLVLVSSGIGWADLSTGLVAHYEFDGDAEDASGNGHDGTVYGATLTADRFGNPNSAYHFDGEDDYIEVANTDEAFSLTNAWTISVWCQPLASVSYGTSGPIIWKTAVDGHNFDTFGVSWQLGDTWQLKLERASDDQDFGVVSSVYTPGQWYHLGGTYDGQYLSLYIDGALNATREIGPVVAYTGSAPLMIGSAMNTDHGDRGVFDGDIDEVRIYDRALTESEIDDLSVVPLPGAVLLGSIGLGVAGYRLRRRC